MSNAGCAQIGAPTGGPRDSIAPKLMSASPPLNSTNFTGNKITLNFNEYVEIKEAQTNVLISPFPKRNPNVDHKLRTVTVKLRDTLLPNTTYSINFGNAIVDINEGNALKDFTYVFSTGSQIDTLMLLGKVLLAETGKSDSTLIAALYRNADDSAVQKRKPDYVARLTGDGSFAFINLPPGNFKIYALKDGDGGKTYNSKKELFGFAKTDITVSEKTEAVVIYASALEKENRNVVTPKAGTNKKLLYTLPSGYNSKDLVSPLEINFNNPLKVFEPAKLILKDSNNNPVPAAVWTIDSSRTKITLTHSWQQGMQYKLILDTTSISDSTGNILVKTDTIRFTTKQQSDYGNVVLRFSDLDLSKNPVVQFVQGDEIKYSKAVTSPEWNNKFILPGDYDIRILFDANKNGRWDPGDYSKKLQPEKVITLSQKLSIRADWDNEREIKL